MKPEFTEFVRLLNEKFPKDDGRAFAEGFMLVPGKRYTKIVMERNGVPCSAYGFIDNDTGDLFRAASFAGPAKHARGNIYEDTALQACGQYSVASLR